MNLPNLDFWSQIAPGIAINLTGLFVAWMTRKFFQKIVDTIATKDFVTECLKLHEEKMMANLEETFQKASAQAAVNMAVETRLSLIEKGVRELHSLFKRHAGKTLAATLVVTDQPEEDPHRHD